MKRILLFLFCTFILGLFSANAKEVYYRINQDELVQLNQFYQQCNGPNWIRQHGWPLPDGEQTTQPSAQGVNFKQTLIQSDDEKTIYELSCTYIIFVNNNLSGTIPNFNLPNLEQLMLSNNHLSGTIPNFDLPKLMILSLDSNQLSGTIPNFNLPNLGKLDLGHNQLSGTIPNFNLPNLGQLDLSNNQLSGTIPNFNLPNLGKLDLGRNQLSGTIPNFNLLELQELYLSNNQLSGMIPNFNLSNLAVVDLSSNLINDIGNNIVLSPNVNFLSVQHNKIDFKALNNCIAYKNIMVYSPQDTMYKIAFDTLNYTLTVMDDSNAYSRYKWYKNDTLHSELSTRSLALSKNDDFWISFLCEVENSNWPGLIINAKTTKAVKYKIDDLERVQLNNFYNQCNGPNWYVQDNWPLADIQYDSIPKIKGLTFDKSIVFYSCDSAAFKLNVNGIELVSNNLSGIIPNLQFKNLKYVDIRCNKFTFKDLENLSGLQNINYWGQDTILPLDFDNATRRLTVKTEGKYNTYKWYKLYSVVKNSSDNFITLSASDNPDDYGCVINNTLFTEITFYTRAPLGAKNWLSVYPAFDVYNISLYPNPCVNNISVDYHFDYSGTVTAKIYDTGGNLLLTLDGIPPEGTQQINLSNFSNGMYNLIFEFGGRHVSAGSFVVAK